MVYVGTAIFDEFREDAIDYIDFAFWLIAMIGLFNYCYNRSVIDLKFFWKLYFPFLVVWDLYILFKDIVFELETSSILSIIVIDGIYILVLIPQFIGLYHYAYTKEAS